MSDYGKILMSTANAVGTSLKKKMGSLTGYAPVDWAETINKLGNKLPERTVSGAVCTFSDGADDVPMPSVKASITAVQAGSGDPSPSNVREISGFAECDVTHTKKNVICSNDSSFPMSENGIACPSVASGNKNTLIFDGHLSLGKWTLKENAPNASNTTHQMALIKNGTIIRYITVDPYTFTVESEDDIYKVRLYVYANNTETYVKPQLEKGDTATDYESYAGETIPVWMGGKNRFINPATTQTIQTVLFTVNSNKSVTCNGTATAQADLYMYGTSSVYVDLGLPAGNYIINGGTANAKFLVVRRRDGQNTVFSNAGNDESMDIADGDTFRVMIRVQNGVQVSNVTVYPMIRPATESDNTYEPCRYIYGGELNLTTGVLTVDRIFYTFSSALYYGTYGAASANLYYIEIPDSQTIPIVPYGKSSDSGFLLSNMFKKTTASNFQNMADDSIRTGGTGTYPSRFYFRSDGFADLTAVNTFLTSNPLQIIAELVNPTTIQLTPEEVRSFLGTNNLWANTGDSEVTYFAQPNVPTEVLYKGQISTTSDYATANFTESVADDVDILVKVYCPARSAVDYKVIKVADIGNGLNVGFNLHTTVNCTITKTSIASYQYSGDYYDIYADVLAYDSAIFN